MRLHSASRKILGALGLRLVREADWDASIRAEARRLQLSELAYDSTRDGSLAPEEYALLEQLVGESNTRPGPLIEIGTLFGRTTSKMALWKAPGKKIFTLDNYAWNPWKLTPQMHFQLTSLVLQYLTDAGHVVQVRADKDEWMSQYHEQPPALVFCDADHSYEATARDIRLARQAGAQIVCGHDYSAEHPGVVRAVDESGGCAQLAGTLWRLKAA